MSLVISAQRPDGSIGYFLIPAESSTRKTALMGLLFVAAHVPLALAIKQYSTLSTLHALITFGAGLWMALSPNRLRDVAYIGAYLTGAEVLWRMTSAQVPWEFCKYSTGLIFIIALLRNGRLRMPLLPILYFALLLPAIVPTVMHYYMPLEYARQMVSSNLSGPFALMACAWFFSHIKLNSTQLESLFLSIIGPSVAIAVITLFSTVTAEHLAWGTQSNFTASGGFGPNQVSGAIGLGVLMALLLLIRTRASTWYKVLIFLTLVFLIIQSALTFSRGGLFGALGGALVCVFFLVRKSEWRGKLFLVIGALLLAAFVALPLLERMTEGALLKRFEDANTSGRAEIAQSDLRMWEKNPVFGVGIGMSFFREMGWKVTHTEFTRLLAEHGLFGLAALFLLFLAAGTRLRKMPTAEGKAVIGAMLAWTFLFMVDKAMRLVAPSFMFGFAFATFEPEPAEGDQTPYLLVRQPSPQSLQS